MQDKIYDLEVIDALLFGGKVKTPSPYKFKETIWAVDWEFYPLVHPALSQFPLTTSDYQGEPKLLDEQKVDPIQDIIACNNSLRSEVGYTNIPDWLFERLERY